MRRPTIFIFIVLAALFSTSNGPVMADDFRQLNWQGIESMRAGDLEKSEECFRAALKAYQKEPSRYDLSIQSNLNLLLSKKRACEDTLSGRVSETHTLSNFVQPFFDNEASKRMQHEVKIPLNYLKLSAETDSVSKVTYTGEVSQGLLELEARVSDLGGGKYKLLSISSNFYRPVALQANKNFSLFKDDEAKKHIAAARKAPPAAPPQPPKQEQKMPELPVVQPESSPPPPENPPDHPQGNNVSAQANAPAPTPEEQAAAAAVQVYRYQQYLQQQGNQAAAMPSCR